MNNSKLHFLNIKQSCVFYTVQCTLTFSSKLLPWLCRCIELVPLSYWSTSSFKTDLIWHIVNVLWYTFLFLAPCCFIRKISWHSKVVYPILDGTKLTIFVAFSRFAIKLYNIQISLFERNDEKKNKIVKSSKFRCYK